jgi:hypothetical protein
MPICTIPMPPKAPIARQYKSLKSSSPCEAVKSTDKNQTLSVGTPTTVTSTSGASSASMTVNISLSDVERMKERRRQAQSISTPASQKVVDMRKWTVSLMAGMARTNYHISGSTCDAVNCRGVVTRVYIFDAGAQLQFRPSSSLSLGLAVTKEQAVYGTVGFNF